MTPSSSDSRSDSPSEWRAFRFRLRHDQFLRQRLKRAKQEATLALARELGFELTLEDLQPGVRKGQRGSGRSRSKLRPR